MGVVVISLWSCIANNSDVNKDWRLKAKDRTKDLQTLWFINVFDKLYSMSTNSQKVQGNVSVTV